MGEYVLNPLATLGPQFSRNRPEANCSRMPNLLQNLPLDQWFSKADVHQSPQDWETTCSPSRRKDFALCSFEPSVPGDPNTMQVWEPLHPAFNQVTGQRYPEKQESTKRGRRERNSFYNHTEYLSWEQARRILYNQCFLSPLGLII